MTAQKDADARTVPFGERLKKAADLVGGVDALADRTGIKRRTLYDHAANKTEPRISVVAQIVEETKVSMDWLVSGAGQMLERGALMQPSASGDGVSVPRFDVSASAGAGALVLSEDVSEYFTVSRDWLRRQLPSWAPLNSAIGFLDGSGDSMEPTIRDGDLLVIVLDVEWRIVERGGIFVFSLDDRLLLKRLQVLANGDLEIISDNKAYRTDTVKFDDIQYRVRIHGMVFFAGGKPRSF